MTVRKQRITRCISNNVFVLQRISGNEIQKLNDHIKNDCTVHENSECALVKSDYLLQLK